MIIKYQTPEEIGAACDLALEYSLYSLTGVMVDWYKERLCIKVIYIKFYKLRPRGVFAILKDNWRKDYNCGTYVNEDYRRKGIGSELVRTALKDGEEVKGWKDVQRAKNFYEFCLQSV